MADLYVKHTGSNTAPYDTWAKAATTLATAMGAAAAGDTVFVASTHVETQATAMSMTGNGTLAAPIRILSVTEASPPTTVTAGASISTTVGGTITLPNSTHIEGVVFDAGSATSAASLNFASPSTSVGTTTTIRGATLRNNSANSANRVAFGTVASNVIGGKYLIEACAFRFAHAGASLQGNGGELRFVGCNIEDGGTAITTLYRGQTGNQKSQAFFDACDFTNAATSVTLAGTMGAGASATFKNCKLPSGWTGTLAANLYAGARASMYNCDSGNTNYRMQIAEYHGDIYSETGIYRTGGASDGTTPLSWRMVTNANALKDSLPLMSDEIVVWNDSTTSKTLTIEIAQEGGTALKDDEVWVEVQYLGSADTLGSVTTDRKVNLLAAGVDQTTSTVAWVGFTSATKQRLSVTFTPAKAGPIFARVYLSKPSTTIYVCPKAELT